MNIDVINLKQHFTDIDKTTVNNNLHFKYMIKTNKKLFKKARKIMIK